jgi:hypothetical protein
MASGGNAITEQYRATGSAYLPGLFPETMLALFYGQLRDHIAATHGSWDAFTARGPLTTRDAIEIYSMHYAPMQSFLWGLTPRIALATGCHLVPTYAYLRLYQGGDICRVHSDRPACEHSLSLTMAYGDDKPWEFSVSIESCAEPSPTISEDFAGASYKSVAMCAGDGVLYQGVHHRHGRLDPNPNAWSAHMFLHWVDLGSGLID